MVLACLALKAGTDKLCYIFALLIIMALIPTVEAHQLFNSEEQKIGGYKIKITTDPEIPGPGNPSRILLAITDYDSNDLIDVMVGLKLFKNDVLIHQVTPRVYNTGHIEVPFTFPESGIYIAEVEIPDGSGNVISSKFNLSIIQTFGYIFYSMIIIGACFPPTLLGVIFFMKRRKAKQVRS